MGCGGSALCEDVNPLGPPGTPIPGGCEGSEAQGSCPWGKEYDRCTYQCEWAF